MSTIINCISYAEGQRVASLEIDQVHDALKDPKQFVWIGLPEPDAELMRKVQHEFNLHELAIEDALRAHQRPKVEVYGDNLFVVIRTVEFQDNQLHPEWGETHLFLGKNFFISVRHGTSTPYKDVRARCECAPQRLAQGPSFVLYALMDAIVDRFPQVVERLEHKLDHLEDKIFHGEANRSTTAELYELKRDLIEFRRALLPLVDVCTRLARFDISLIPDEGRPYFRDVADHVMRLNEVVDGIRELLSAAMDANLSQISISQNEVTKRLAGWAAIIAVPTLVAGIYGMNFDVMPELRTRYGYPIILIFTLLICSLMYRHFKRSGWFE